MVDPACRARRTGTCLPKAAKTACVRTAAAVAQGMWREPLAQLGVAGKHSQVEGRLEGVELCGNGSMIWLPTDFPFRLQAAGKTVSWTPCPARGRSAASAAARGGRHFGAMRGCIHRCHPLRVTCASQVLWRQWRTCSITPGRGPKGRSGAWHRELLKVCAPLPTPGTVRLLSRGPSSRPSR